MNQKHVTKTRTIIYRSFRKDEQKTLSENETIFTGDQIKYLPEVNKKFSE